MRDPKNIRPRKGRGCGDTTIGEMEEWMKQEDKMSREPELE